MNTAINEKRRLTHFVPNLYIDRLQDLQDGGKESKRFFRYHTFQRLSVERVEYALLDVDPDDFLHVLGVSESGEHECRSDLRMPYCEAVASAIRAAAGRGSGGTVTVASVMHGAVEVVESLAP